MKEKKELGKGMYQAGNGDVGLFMGSFPRKLALEWEKDCKDNYGGCRWTKAYSDHCKARQLETEDLIAEMHGQPDEVKEKEEKIPTLGKGE